MMKYTTTQGDKWDLIAYKTLGDTAYTNKVMQANTRYVGVYIFQAGIELDIPDVTAATKDEDLPPWKRG